MHLNIIKQNCPKTWTSGPSAFAAIILSRPLAFYIPGQWKPTSAHVGDLMRIGKNTSSIHDSHQTHAQVEFMESRGAKEAKSGLALKKSLF